jgi:hypothetical protein
VINVGWLTIWNDQSNPAKPSLLPIRPKRGKLDLQLRNRLFQRRQLNVPVRRLRATYKSIPYGLAAEE